MKTNKVGELRIASGKVLVSDPCYIPDSLDGNGTHIVKMAKGLYPVTVEVCDNTETGGWGDRVNSILLGIKSSRDFHLGHAFVDSGQMSFMDASLIPFFRDIRDEGQEWDSGLPGSFNYQGMCHETLTNSAGIIDKMIAGCSAGYGDGSYRVITYENDKNKVIGIKVDFDVTYNYDEEDDDEAFEEDE